MTVITPVRMPKWGLSMQEGTIIDWWKAEGAVLAEGDDLVDIETSKITNVCESPAAGILRRVVARPGETLPVGALIAVVAASDAPDAQIDAFVAAFQANFVPADENDDAAQALRLSTVDVGGRGLRAGRAGPADGVPVVLIHGYAGDMNNWLFNIEALSAAHPVIALDLPGHGGSEKDVGDGSLAAFAHAVRGALETMGVTRAHLIGHSLGAAVAARAAIDQPGLAQSVVLIAPAGLSAAGVSETFLTGVIDADRARDLKPFMDMLLADPALVTKDMVDDVIKFKRLDGVEESLSRVRDRLIDGADLAALRADMAALPRTLILASAADRIVGVPDRAALPPQADMIMIDGVGHMPHLEKAAHVNALLLEWLEG